MIDRYRDASAPDPLLPAAAPGGLTQPPRPGPGACAASMQPPAPRGRRLNEARRRACCSACLLAAVLVLWAGTALGQTVTISPTTDQSVQEGNSFSFTLTVADATANHSGYLDFVLSGAVLDDFDVYKQATAPTTSDTPITIDTYEGTYYYELFAAGSAPTAPVKFWFLAKTDSVYFEADEQVTLSGSLFDNDFVEGSVVGSLAVTVTDAPLPDPTGKPTTPANLTAAAGTAAVTLAWDAIDTTSSNTNLVNDVNITKHQYCQKTDTSACAATDWTDIPNSAFGEVNANTYTIGSLTDGTEYTFRVRAVNECATTTGCGISDAATAVTATPVADALAAPTGLTATAGNTQVILTWTDPGNDAILYYEYQQKEGQAPFGAWTEISDSSATTTSHRLTGLNNGTAYSYRIRAGTYPKPSPSSDAVTVTPRGAPPAAPVLSATARSDGVTLSWPNPHDDTIQSYEYQYRVGTGVYQPWQSAPFSGECGVVWLYTNLWCAPEVHTSDATLQFPVGGLTNGTPHTFRVRAVNAQGATTSNEATATPVAGVPAKPTGLRTDVSTSREGDTRRLYWDPLVDPSILRYEYTADEGRTWARLAVNRVTQSRGSLPRDEGIHSGYTIRIRAVNDAGPGPASEPAVGPAATVVTAGHVRSASLEYDAAAKKATLAWDQTTHASLRWWNLFFDRTVHGQTVAPDLDAVLPIGTTRYEIPGMFDPGDDIAVYIWACIRPPCLQPSSSYVELRFKVGGVDTAPTGFSATPGDAQITLAWDDPADSSITKYQYQLDNSTAEDIPDGDDAGTDPGDETSYTVTGLDNGSSYSLQLRAVNANGDGPWTEWIRGIMPLAPGAPAPPSGLVTLRYTSHGRLTIWDDPQDPSITLYQKYSGNPGTWQNIAGSHATTTGVGGHLDRLRAVNAKGPGPWVSPGVALSKAPAQPTGLRAVPGIRRVTLTWDDPGDPREGVYIASYRYTADGGETWTTIPGSHTTARGHLTRYTVPNLTSGQAYTFAIQAQNESPYPRGPFEPTRISPPSAAVTATPLGGAPAKPTDLSAAPGDAEATLTWNNPGDASVTKYEIKQGSAAWADITGSDASTTSHTVESLANGTAVTFQIRAVNDHDGDSTDDPGAASDAVSVTPGVPEAPASLVGVPGDTQVTLTWTAPAGNNGSAVTGYEYTSNADAATPTWTDVPDGSDAGTDRADETEYTATSLVNNTVYAFAVRAENANGQGAATRTLRAMPAPAGTPQRPALRAIPGNHEVLLRWARPSFQHPVTSYQYRQSTDGGATWSPDWTALAGSGPATSEHRLTGLANGTTYTFELRPLNGSTAGPSARAQATPGATAFYEVINSRATTSNTSLSGSAYTVTRLSAPVDLNWSVRVPHTTEVGGHTFTVRSLQGTTPYTSPRHRFTSTGQEGLDIVVHPPLAGPAQVCLEPSDELRLEAGSRPLQVLRHSGGWSALPTSADGDMLCGTTTGFSAFVLGYAAPVSRSAAPDPAAPADNAAPQAAQPIPPQTVLTRSTGAPLDLAPYFRDPDGDRLHYVAVSGDVGVVIADLARGSSRLTLHGMAAGQAVVTVTASDPHGGSVSQRLAVTVTPQASTAPAVAQRIPPQTVQVGATSPPLDLRQYFRDPDGDRLTYVAVSYDTDVLVAEVAAGGSELTLRGVASGDAGVIVTATDPYGAHASQPVTVMVRTAAELAAAQPLPPQTVQVGADGEPLDLAPHFAGLDGGPFTYAAVSDDPAVLVAEVAAGSSELTLRGVAAGQAVVTVTASGPGGGSVSRRLTVTVSAPNSAAPEVVQRIPPQAVLVGRTALSLDLAAYFQDPDGDPLTYAVASYDADVLVAQVVEGTDRLTLKGVAVGDAGVIVTASDPHGGHASQPVTVTVRTNAAPAAAQPIAPQTVLAGAAALALELGPYFQDPDGDPLTYAAVSDNAAVLVAGVAEDDKQLILRGVAAGESVIAVVATDPFGAQASQIVAVTVRVNTVLQVSQPIPPQTVVAGAVSEPLDLAPYFHDPDGDPLAYTAASSNGAVLVAGVAEGSTHLTLRGVAAGEATVVVTAADPFDEQISQFVRVRVRTNAAPAASQPIPPQTLVAGAADVSLDLAPHFQDPDGDPLTCAASSSNPAVLVAEVSQGGDRLTLRGVSAGEAVVTVMASDPYGGHASQAVTVTVRTSAAPQAVQAIPPQTVPLGAASAPLDLAAYFHDPDGDPLTYAAVPVDAAVLVAEAALGDNRASRRGMAAAASLGLAPRPRDAAGNPLVYAAVPDATALLVAEVAKGDSQLNLRGVAAGEAVVIVSAADPYGGYATQTVRVAVRTSAVPEAVQAIPPQTVVAGAAGEPLDLGPYFRDPDGDPLTYAASSENPAVVVAEVAADSGRLILRGVAAGDPHGGHVSQTLTVTVRANAAPAVAQPLPAHSVPVGAASAPLDLGPYFHDPDGDPLAYVAVSNNPAVLVAEVPKGANELTLRGAAAGEAIVVVTAADPYGGYVTQTMRVAVRTNAAPEVAQPMPPQRVLAGAAGAPLHLAAYFRDPDGDPLTYAAVSDSPAVLVAEVEKDGSQLTLRGVAAGDAVVTVTAADPFGAEAGQVMAVTVRTNAAPEVAQPIPPQSLAAGAATPPLDLAAYFRDPDGDPLTYAAVSDDPAVATAAVADGLLTLSAVAAGAAAVRVTARDPHGAEAGQSVTVTVRAAAPVWLQAWTARFGRTVSGQVLDGVRERLHTARRAGFHATLAGHQLGGMGDEAAQAFAGPQPGGAAAFRRELDALAAGIDEQMNDPAGNAASRQALTGRDLLTSSAFTLTGGNVDNGFGTLWGRGAVSHFASEDGALSLDGEVATGMLGFDWVSGRWLSGLALAMSRGAGGYQAPDGSGDIESTLAGFYPWVGYHLTDRLSLWAALGYGAGVLTVTPRDEAATAADLSLVMVAAGARSEVLELPQLGGVVLAVETDTRLTRTATGAAAGLPATDASVWQLRLGLEGSRHVALHGGGALRPSVEVGLRHDGGDAETGGGIEVGAGLSFSRPVSGLSLDLAARGLLAHRASGFEEWGAGASLTWDPAPSSEEGLSMSLQQSVGASSAGGVNALLARDTMAASPGVAGIDAAGRLQARVGYGLPLAEGRFIGTPQLGFGLSEGRHDYTLGWQLSVARRQDLDLTLGIEASRRENPDAGNPEHGVMLQFRLGH